MIIPVGSFLQNGKYKIVRFISSGGFGCTYEAELVALHKRVAIKEFFVNTLCQRDSTTSRVSVGVTSQTGLVNRLRQKFLDEAIAISNLKHGHIVSVFDVFDENGTSYYVMDYIDGESLSDKIKRREKLPVDEAVDYILQIADALSYVHSTKRLHLDIKPGNIMVDSQGNAILIDFGVSKQYDEENGFNTSTIAGKTMGYAPLEQISGKITKFTCATDIYALGATLYKLVTGCNPPDASDVLEKGFPTIPNFIPSHVAGAIVKAMEPRIADRPASMKEFAALLIKNPTRVSDVNQDKTEIYSEGGGNGGNSSVSIPKPKKKQKDVQNNVAQASTNGSGTNANGGQNVAHGFTGGSTNGKVDIKKKPQPKKSHFWLYTLLFIFFAAAAGVGVWYFLNSSNKKDAVDTRAQHLERYEAAIDEGNIDELIRIYNEGEYYDVAFDIAMLYNQEFNQNVDNMPEDEAYELMTERDEWLEKSSKYSPDAAMLRALTAYNVDEYDTAYRYLNIAEANLDEVDYIDTYALKDTRATISNYDIELIRQEINGSDPDLSSISQEFWDLFYTLYN